MLKFLLVVLTMVISLTGCSLLPRLTFDTPNTLPQSIDKSKSHEKCQGETKFDSHGEIIYCSRGYYNYSENYVKKERKMTIIEKIKSFVNSLAGWGFWGLVLIILLCPSLIGYIIGALFNSARTALTETIKAISNFRKNESSDCKETLDNYLRNAQSTKTKEIIAKERVKLNSEGNIISGKE